MFIIDFLLTHKQPFIAILSAASATLAVIAIAWPHIALDSLTIRMKSIEGERERLRQKDSEVTEGIEKLSLTTKAPKLYQTIFDNLNLDKQAQNGKTAHMLLMAGFRGKSPLVRFMAIRILSPIFLFAITLAYIPVVIAPDVPFIVIVLVAAAIGSLGYFVPGLYVRNRIAKRQKSIKQAWPDALDLLLISIESGMSVEAAFRTTAEEISSRSVHLAEELSITTAEMSYLQDRRAAFDNLSTRTGLYGVRAVVTSLIQSERYGTPLGKSLRVLAKEMRDERMNDAEKKAASLSPKLTVPMIIFFLPALFVIIIMPALIKIFALS